MIVNIEVKSSMVMVMMSFAGVFEVFIRGEKGSDLLSFIKIA